MSISREAWVAALGEVIPQEDDQDAVTVIELAALLGCCRNTAQTHAAQLVKEGKARETYKRGRRSDGRPCIARAYRLIS